MFLAFIISKLPSWWITLAKIMNDISPPHALFYCCLYIIIASSQIIIMVHNVKGRYWCKPLEKDAKAKTKNLFDIQWRGHPVPHNGKQPGRWHRDKFSTLTQCGWSHMPFNALWAKYRGHSDHRECRKLFQKGTMMRKSTPQDIFISKI